MTFFLQSHDYEMWELIEDGYIHPTTDRSEWSAVQKKRAALNAKGVNTIFCALSPEEFNRVFNCKTAKEIWTTLEITHEETTKVKKTKINLLVSDFEAFKIKNDESISETRKKGLFKKDKPLWRERDGKEDDPLRFYKCKKVGHIRPNCPLNKQEDNSRRKKKEKNKGFSATWDGLSCSSASEEEDQNVCFMELEPHEEEICVKGSINTDKWYLDSGCSRHMTRYPIKFSSITMGNQGKVTFGDNKKGKIIGEVTITFKDITISNVFLVDGLVMNLLTISQLCDVGNEDNLHKFDLKSDDGIFLGYSNRSRAYRVYNKRTLIVEKAFHVKFDESQDPKSMINDDEEEDPPKSLENNESKDITKKLEEVNLGNEELIEEEETLFNKEKRIMKNHPNSQILGDPS
ncbi:uncharacterized protein LOC143889473 [Tasmannia lanceolata]|uniref:uncharacterized protein LOC143889473 n=1 Tax=Tasmannia lanceolata TaxID=3420 RepID=UPI0040638EA5